MKHRKIGATDLLVPELGFGCGAIGNLYRAVDHETAHAVLQAAWDHGITYFDTAPYYGHGLSERRLGDFLRTKSGWILSTKVGKLLSPVRAGAVPDHGFADPLPFDVSYDYSGEGILRSLEASYHRLGLSRIDVVWVHDLEPKTHGAAYQDHLQAFLSSGIRVLEKLKADGTIRAYGLGVNEVSPCLDVLRATDLDAILLAGRYTLLDRGAEATLLPICRERNVSLVIGGVFNSGILATGTKPGAVFDYGPAPAPILERVKAMEGIASQHEIALATAALQFPLRDPITASVLLGTAKVSSLQRNIEVFDHVIPTGFWEAATHHAM